VTAADWIATLGLARHPEGGWFRETYRAAEGVAAAHLPARYGGRRAFSTAMFFLLHGEEVSRLHRLRSDEIWHFHAGAPLTLAVIHPSGTVDETRLGTAVAAGERLQATVPAGTWFGAWVADPSSYALVGCTVAPGFDFADFELADRDRLLADYPQHRALIERLT
jgi:predicted cupin superfamily sugar epimerase